MGTRKSKMEPRRGYGAGPTHPEMLLRALGICRGASQNSESQSCLAVTESSQKTVINVDEASGFHIREGLGAIFDKKS